jgi:PAS domain S-box-containing protein
VQNIETAFDSIEHTILPGISKSLWELDKEHLQKYAEGICNKSLVEYARITTDDGTVIEAGTPATSDPIIRDIPIMHLDAHYSLKIGTLQLQSDHRRLLNEIIEETGTIFIFLIIIIFGVATFFFIIFNRLVTSNLLEMASYIDGLPDNTLGAPLVLKRARRNDEFDKVVDVFNNLRENLNKSIEELTNSKEVFSKTFFSAPLLMTISSLENGKYIEANNAFLEVTGFTREEVIGSTSIEIGWIQAEDRNRMVSELQHSGRIRDMELELTARNGQKVYCLYAGEIININGEERLLSIALNISEERRLNKEQEAMRAKLNQAQKMEAVGRLAGGVAHDFNNKLTVIMGYVDLMKMSGKLDAQLLSEIDIIRKAACQSQEITRQLLAFSRKETIAPQRLDLNFQLRDELKVLNRLLGEDIEMVFKLGDELWPIMMDPAQLDQIFMNLAANARDAMPQGGSIRFETRNIRIGEEAPVNCIDCLPGEYVLLRVTDTGNGISPDLLGHIFEPFFTTKEKDKGTGLGLATVYGIVTQNKGFINVASDVDKGTSFDIYLPRTAAAGVQHEASPMQTIKGGNEHILLVEDEDDVRSMLKTLLQGAGYAVMAIADPQEAISYCEDQSHVIDLLITDVIMPKINGKELEYQASSLRPDLKVLFMSGYSDNLISKYGVLDKEINFVHKPINFYDFSVTIRNILDANPLCLTANPDYR